MRQSAFSRLTGFVRSRWDPKALAPIQSSRTSLRAPELERVSLLLGRDNAAHLTKRWLDPDVSCNLVLASLLQRLEVVFLSALLCLGRPRKGDLEHARRTDEAISAPPLPAR